MPAMLVLLNPSPKGRRPAKVVGLPSAVKAAAARAVRATSAPRKNPSRIGTKAAAEKARLDRMKADLFAAGFSASDIAQMFRVHHERATKRRASSPSARKNPTKEIKMARRRRVRSSSIRRNPTKKGNLTKREIALNMVAAGEMTEAMFAKLYGSAKTGRVAKPRMYGPKLPPEMVSAQRRARGQALAAAQRAKRAAMGAAELAAYKEALKAKSAASREKSKAALARAELLVKAAEAQGVPAPAKELALITRAAEAAARRAVSYGKFSAARSAGAKARAKTKFDARIADYRGKGWKAHIAAAGLIRARKSPAQVALARAYMSAKSAVAKHGAAPGSKGVMRVLGLSSLPNPNFSADLKTLVPMIALGAGGVIGVAWGVSKILPMVQDKLPESVRPWVAPALALTVGVGGSYLMRKNPSLSKFSGAVLGGGIAVAAFAAMNAWKDASGVSMAKKVGLAGLGDYHMGMSVGDYHMGDVAPLNFGDYHMGAIDVVTDRRMLAPPGQPMPRHDTRRDGVDQSIESFSGTLAGDIFDQG